LACCDFITGKLRILHDSGRRYQKREPRLVAPVETLRRNCLLVLPQRDRFHPPELRKVPDSVVTGLQEEDEFWYANKTFKKKAGAKNEGITTLYGIPVLNCFGY
jgi:hypothetical protein